MNNLLFFCRQYRKWIFCLIFLVFIIAWVATHWLVVGTHAIRNTPKTLSIFLDPITSTQTLVSPEQQKLFMQDFLTHYYSPWTGEKLMYDNAYIKQSELDFIDQFTHNKGWGFNQHRYPSTWIKTISANMQIDKFPNYQQPGIVINPTALRVLPTQDPNFEDLWQPGKGYPFDRLQQSWLAANTPVLTLQLSRDGMWALVLTHNQVGWVERHDVADIDKSLMQAWLKSTYYITPLLDNIPLRNENNQFYRLTRVGTLYPLLRDEGDDFIVIVAATNNHQQAVLQEVHLSKKIAVVAPWSITPQHVAIIAEPMLGDPYGWGEIYSHRDCSATLMDVFTAFGIWLPRSSYDQALAWRYINLSTLNKAEKEKTILQQAVPFFTLLDLHGHIMLYIGNYKNKAYAFHDVWGLHTITNGRLVIGRTIISPITLGADYYNTHSLINGIHGMTMLGLPATKTDD